MQFLAIFTTIFALGSIAAAMPAELDKRCVGVAGFCGFGSKCCAGLKCEYNCGGELCAYNCFRTCMYYHLTKTHVFGMLISHILGRYIYGSDLGTYIVGITNIVFASIGPRTIL